MFYYLSIFWLLIRIGLLNELAYRTNFWTNLFQSIMQLGVALAGLSVVFSHTETLGGWSREELSVLVGMFFLISGLIQSIIYPGLQRFVDDVSQGTLDFVLARPLDAQFFVSVRGIHIWKLADVMLGGLVMMGALTQLESAASAPRVIAFSVALLSGIAIVYSVWFSLAITAFWVVRVEILLIFQSLYEAGRWPVHIYPRWLQFALTFLVPVALAVTTPSEALLGRMSLQTCLGVTGLAIVMLLVSRMFWKFGLRHYTGASA